MKKNRMMRFASLLLVATLMSTCTISGTFAKYVTKGEAMDKARVAKWGVNITAAGELFSQTYVEAAAGNTPGSGAITVESSDTDKVVAPGTQNDTGITFTITGQPEVDSRIIIAVTGKDNAEKATDIYLEDGKYFDPTTATIVDDEKTLGADYHPVKFTLTRNGTELVKDGTLDAVETALEGLSVTNIPANTNLAATHGTFKLTWKWDFGTAAELQTGDVLVDNIADTDVWDTILGNAAASGGATGAHTNLDFNLKILVEQVD